MESDIDAFTRVLRSFRERRGMSQRELAAAAGLDHKTVMAYERGQTVPRTEANVVVLGDGLELDGAQRQILRDAYLRARAARRTAVADAIAEPGQPHLAQPMPIPPEPYVAHPYVLLQTKRLIGRQAELEMLNAWVGGRLQLEADAPLLALIGIGGMGKSALTWTWFTSIAPNVMPKIVGRMWWSFYERDAGFEQFVIRALAYVSHELPENIRRELAPNEREDQLLRSLDREPFLLVLDGLERILLAYAGADAALLRDEEVDAAVVGSESKTQGKLEAGPFPGHHRLRKTIDPRVGGFLRRLAAVRASRILISTRLAPADLETVTGVPLPGCELRYLPGLRSLDALALWRAFGVSGAGETLLPMFDTVENHPLIIQALAGAVARYRPAPGDFERWRRDHPDFSPAELPLVQRKSHVLAFALRGLDAPERAVLETIAAVRMPAGYDMLVTLSVGSSGPFEDEGALDAGLTDLEDRGLVGWDRAANRYDLHPIVRSVVWEQADNARRRAIYEALQHYFGSLPKMTDWKRIQAIEDLTAAIEWYHSLIGVGRYDDAYLVFSEYLSNALLYRLSANRERAVLLERLFPDGKDAPAQLQEPFAQTYVSSALFQSYADGGRCGEAVRFYRQQQEYLQEEIGMINVGDALWLAGQLYDAEAEARGQLADSRELEAVFQEAQALHLYGLILTLRGEVAEGGRALDQALRIFDSEEDAEHFAAVTSAWLAQRAIWVGGLDAAQRFADRAAQLAEVERQERDIVISVRLQGVIARELQLLSEANAFLHQALTRARTANLIDEELQICIAFAELLWQQGDVVGARAFLDEVWEPAERGPFPLFHVDALNVLAQIERDAGNHAAAVAAATDAYRLAWCDGPPYVYHRGLEIARSHLAALGAELPTLPPLDEARHMPMPIADIDGTNEP
jgi:transcriptional regulator with XRE-family HTH domain/tetratricopeptide (TPR) repeat protein